MMFLSVFPLPLLFLSLLPACSSATHDSFLANDRCSVLLSGSRASNSVRSVFFDCDQGSLLWERPTGPNALLLTFSPPAPHQSQLWRICFRFVDPWPAGTTVQQMVNSRLLPPLPLHSLLHCLPLDASPSPQQFRLFIRISPPPASSQLHSSSSDSLALFYAIEPIPGEGDHDLPCGRCSQDRFMSAFCSTNFVFRGKLLRYAPEGNSLDFSAESPLIRRPLSLAHIVGKGTEEQSRDSQQQIQFNTTTLFSADCSPDILLPSLHTTYIVVANAHLGFARLQCLLELSEFSRISPESAPCDLGMAITAGGRRRKRRGRMR